MIKSKGKEINKIPEGFYQDIKLGDNFEVEEYYDTLIPNDLVDKLMPMISGVPGILTIIQDLLKQTYKAGLSIGRNEPSMFAIIPLVILENKTLSANSKLLYAEIIALSKKTGNCYATNKYLAQRLGLSPRTIPSLLKELDGSGLVAVSIERSKRGTYRYIALTYINVGEGQAVGGQRHLALGATSDSVDKREINKRELNKDILADQPSTIGQPIKEDRLKTHKQLISWAAERRSNDFKFPNFAKQLKGLNMMKSAGITPTEIKDRWIEMEEDRYWKEHGFDFMNVVNSFNKKR